MKESLTQNKVIETFKELGYEYLGDFHTRKNNSNIEVEYLKKFLAKRYKDENLVKKAIEKLQKESSLEVNQANEYDKVLYDANKRVYNLLQYGANIKVGNNEKNESVFFIDWNNLENNDFYVAQEVTYKGNHEKRPDVVLYINGIVFCVIELKSAVVDVAQGIRQNITNQRIEIPQFFTTTQIVMAGNEAQGMRYGTILTPSKYFLEWKEYDEKSKKSEKIFSFFDEIKAFFNKTRILDILENFIVYDGGAKKLCRYNQYFGVSLARKKINEHKGGIIWHTQGSGKSLSMVWLAKWWIKEPGDTRVLIITDRTELDEQIERVFGDSEQKIARTRSGADLIDILNKNEESIVCSLIHKFKNGSKKADEWLANDIIENSKKEFSPKGKIIVFVDECHRTQSGKLHEAMKKLLPNAIFIGFTGTPLLKKDKATSLEVFGEYIHTYKFNEAVEDGVVVDLIYEARDINQEVASQDKIDKWFDVKTRGLNESAKVSLKKKWGNMQKVLSSKGRMESIANDIIADFEIETRLADNKGNAMLVAKSVADACKYWKIFQDIGFKKCAVITSYSPYHQDIRAEDTGEDRVTDDMKKYEIYLEMIGVSANDANKDKAVLEYESRVKKEFIEEPSKMKLLIVVDKLLTGFDAPKATFLYIDKKMQDHGLFQAICRVNRLDDDKEYGYIIDYMDLFKCIEKSVNDYTSEALGEYDKKDIEGLLSSREERAKKDFENALEALEHFVENVPEPRNKEDYRAFFNCCENVDDENARKKRYTFYKMVNALVRAFSAVSAYLEPNELEKYKKKVEEYHDLKIYIGLASADSIDLKNYEADMRFMIDTYIKADESKKISNFEGYGLMHLLANDAKSATDEVAQSTNASKESVAETIENHIRKVVTYEEQTNPEFYKKMSEILENLVKERKQESIEYAQYLKKIEELAKNIENARKGEQEDYPININTKGLKALYDNLGQDEQKAIRLDKELKRQMPDDYKNNNMKIKLVKQIIKKELDIEDEEVESIYKIVEANYE